MKSFIVLIFGILFIAFAFSYIVVNACGRMQQRLDDEQQN